MRLGLDLVSIAAPPRDRARRGPPPGAASRPARPAVAARRRGGSARACAAPRPARRPAAAATRGSSSISRTFRSTRPACAARSVTEPLLRRGQRLVRRHRRPTARPAAPPGAGPATAASAPAMAGSAVAGDRNGVGPRRVGRPGAGRTELGRRRAATPSARGAPRPLGEDPRHPREARPRWRTSPAIRSENSDSTSYGVARSPYTRRFASRRARARHRLEGDGDHGRGHERPATARSAPDRARRSRRRSPT